MTDFELAKAVAEWFRVSSGNRRRWSNDEVGVVIREQLKVTGNWKNAPRGNPAKGMAVRLSKRGGGE
jgi:hypothetical protein